MHGITIVIPIYKLGSYRRRNFNFLIEVLSKLNIPIIVAEQIEENKSSLTNKPQYKQYRHITFATDTPVMHKSWLVNQAIKYVETEYMWQIDCDFYMDFSLVTENDYNQYDFFQPYNLSIDLNEINTNILCESGCITERMLSINPGTGRKVQMLGSLSYICKVIKYINIGGLDEKYIGWGLEDIDLFMRLSESDLKLGKTLCRDGVHMWHPISTASRNAGLTNLKYFKSKGYTTSHAKQLYSKMFEH